MLPVFSERLVGTDSDERLLALARRNAVAAGIDDQVHFQCKAFENLTSKREFGCVVTSLPDELASGKWHEVESLYRQVPVVLRRLPTWSHFILTGYPRFEGAAAEVGRSTPQTLQRAAGVHVLSVPRPAARHPRWRAA